MSSMSNKEIEDNEDVWKERCMNCIRCNDEKNCGTCWPCRNGKTCDMRKCFSAKRLYNEKVKRQTDENLKAIMAKTAQREAAHQAATTTAPSAPVVIEQQVEKKKRGRKKGSGNGGAAAAAQQRKANIINERDYVPNRPTRQQSADLRRKRTQLNAEPDKHPRQCLNPNCIYESRIDSKYCSDECGKELARMRLTEILPNRCKQYFFEGPSGGPRSLEDEIKPKRAKINREVQKLTESEKNMMAFLNKLVEFIKTQLKLQPLGTEERYDDNLYEGCIVCGLPDIPLLKYTKHIELCWARSEKAISFGAPEKNNDMFYCEKYDSRTNSFCKRLKSLCPEHRKLGDEQHLKVCGYPKKWEDGMIETAKTVSELIEMEDPFGEEGCRTKKDACHKHHKWIPSLRGTIELEQACLFQKMYELCHEMHKLNAHAEWTTNALSIMMHKQPNIIDSEQMSLFNKSQSTSSSASAHGATTPISSTSSSSSSSSKNDDEMEDTAEFLANLAVQKEEETQNN